MSWRERPYTRDDEYAPGSPVGYGGAHPGDGWRSWLGGLPAPGKAVKWLLVANIAVFGLCLLTGGAQGPMFRWFALYAEDVYRRGQVWRLFSATFLHSQYDIFHLIFNMIGLYFFGQPLERKWGPRRLFIFYTIAGILANVLYTMIVMAGWLPARIGGVQTSLVGASGGIFALLGACAALYPHMQLILVMFPVPIRMVCVLFMLIYGFNVIARGANAGGDACHIAGLVFGVYWGYRGQRWFDRVGGWQRESRQRKWTEQREEALRLEERVDQILDKVRRDGIQSLSRAEKKILEEATRARQSATGRGPKVH